MKHEHSLITHIPRPLLFSLESKAEVPGIFLIDDFTCIEFSMIPWLPKSLEALLSSSSLDLKYHLQPIYEYETLSEWKSASLFVWIPIEYKWDDWNVSIPVGSTLDSVWISKATIFIQWIGILMVFSSLLTVDRRIREKKDKKNL